MTHEPKIHRLFKCTIFSCKYVFQSTKREAHFINGRLPLFNPSEIQELEEEISKGHPHIYIDQNEREIDVANVDPLAKIKAEAGRKAVEEYIREQEKLKTQNPSRDMGNQIPSSHLNIASSRALSQHPSSDKPVEEKPIVQDSQSEVSARLAALRNQTKIEDNK